MERKEQTHKMKKQSVFAGEARKEIDQVSKIIGLILQREREIHGTSMTSGRDGGTICIKVLKFVLPILKVPVKKVQGFFHLSNFKFGLY